MRVCYPTSRGETFSHNKLQNKAITAISSSQKRNDQLSVLKGAMSPNTHARANEKKLEKDGPTFSSCVGDFGRLFLSV